MTDGKALLEDDPPVHPAAHLGSRAVKLFDEIVEETTLRKRAGKTIDLLVNAGLVYDREAGCDDHGFPVYDISARLDAWDAYSAFLDHKEALEKELDQMAEPSGPSF